MRKLDKNQKLAVNCDNNVVVSAGAGAGKTTVLAERYFRLISEGKAGVENILTLTFTRKAATEMNERIYSRLLNSTNTIANGQAAEFDKAKISTLDSFSAQVVRNGSERFGIPSDFLSDNDAASAMAAEIALDFILRKQNDKFLQKFISLHGFESVYEDLFISLAVNEFNLSDPIDFVVLKQRQKTELNSAYHKNMDEMDKIMSDILSLSPDIGKAMLDNVNLFSTLWNTDKFMQADGIKLFLEISDKVKLTKGRGNHPEKTLLNEYIDTWRNILNFTISVAHGIESLPFLEGMFGLLEDFQNIFLSKKRTSGILTFQDVSKMAVSI
ncbi:MAG: UvrD-helicase domain-containing protein, partial [Spirochaetia bacterium]|nr:UvrD-helicase domain-containing protein [Spirochaetia bacterium]